MGRELLSGVLFFLAGVMCERVGPFAPLSPRPRLSDSHRRVCLLLLLQVSISLAGEKRSLVDSQVAVGGDEKEVDCCGPLLLLVFVHLVSFLSHSSLSVSRRRESKKWTESERGLG